MAPLQIALTMLPSCLADWGGSPPTLKSTNCDLTSHSDVGCDLFPPCFGAALPPNRNILLYTQTRPIVLLFRAFGGLGGGGGVSGYVFAYKCVLPSLRSPIPTSSTARSVQLRPALRFSHDTMCACIVIGHVILSSILASRSTQNSAYS